MTTGIVSAAIAQPRRGARPKPKPAATAADAGDNPYSEDTLGGSPPATANAAGGGGRDSASPVDGGAPGSVRADVGDGGVKPSPLNPAANELPTSSGAGGLAATPDYDKLLGDISALRARVAAVTDTMFHSRVALSVKLEGSHSRTARFTVLLDDGVVFTGTPAFRAEDMTPIYEHGVAPGKHAVTVEVERKDDRDETFRTAQRSRFMVEVRKDERLGVELRMEDDSDMGGDFPGGRSGRYDLRVRATATSKPVGR
jgi:hypothetical protein